MEKLLHDWFLVISISLLILPFVLMVVKASFHIDYLKEVYPDKYSKHKSYLDLYNMNKFIDMNRLYLILPYFKRVTDNKENIKAIKLARDIRLICVLIYACLIILFTYVAVLLAL